MFKNGSEWVLAVAWTIDGKLLASASLDKTLLLWDVGSGKELKQFLGPKWGTLGRAQDRRSAARPNDVFWMRSRSAPQPIILNTTVFLYPVRAGFDQFVVQPHLEFCHAIELNLGLSQRP
jgi:WD40 repeat protein